MGPDFDPLFVIPWGHAHDTTESPPECGLITISAGVGDLRNRFARDFQHKRRRFNTNPRDKVFGLCWISAVILRLRVRGVRFKASAS